MDLAWITVMELNEALQVLKDITEATHHLYGSYYNGWGDIGTSDLLFLEVHRILEPNSVEIAVI